MDEINGVILRELHIVEYMDESDGEIYKVDFSHDGTGNDLPLEGVIALAEWAKAVAMAPMIADLVFQFMNDDGEEAEA